MIDELELPVVPAEKLKIETLIWERYEQYAAEFQSRQPYDAQGVLQADTTNPVQVSLKGKFVESMKRTDVFVQTVTLQGTGTPNFNFTIPQNVQIDPQALQTIVNHFLQELNNQLKPFLVAKRLSTCGEWIHE